MYFTSKVTVGCTLGVPTRLEKISQKKTPFLLSIAQITPTHSPCTLFWATLSLLKMCHNQFGQGIPPFEGKGFVLGSLPLVANQLLISQLSRAAAAAGL